MNRNYQNKTKKSKKQVAIEFFIIIVNLDEVWENSGLIDFNAIQDGVGQKVPSPYQFFPCNFYKRTISPQNLLVWNFRFVPSASPKLLNLSQDHCSKKNGFSGQILELPNFGHMTTSIIWFESCDKNFLGDVIDKIYDVITFISKYLYFKKGWGNHFCWHHQNFNHVYYNNLQRLKKS